PSSLSAVLYPILPRHTLSFPVSTYRVHPYLHSFPTRRSSDLSTNTPSTAHLEHMTRLTTQGGEEGCVAATGRALNCSDGTKTVESLPFLRFGRQGPGGGLGDEAAGGDPEQLGGEFLVSGETGVGVGVGHLPGGAVDRHQMPCVERCLWCRPRPEAHTGWNNSSKGSIGT